ncbi:AfsR/SARP family transcriptional regulator [Streptomyces collinus]|uniref:AfsR/SARP family transcriptional regulator n=1 Tax=Streptomyces collinus TaxID=42684 RepID=UPI0029435290|nr:BTAD domain-containing putative transcriptional regulator [Streptomyces collinus]
MTPEAVRFAVLGPVRVWRAGTELDLGGPRERALLALLLVRAGQPVETAEIIDVLWGPNPPGTALSMVRRHVGSLRRLLEPGLPARGTGRCLLRGADGYRMVTDSDSLDLLRFRALLAEGRRAAAAGDQARAAELLTDSLSRWQGPAATAIPAEARAHAAFGTLDREYLAALKDAADAALGAGLPAAVLPRLRAAAADNPLDEPLLSRLMLVLSATGARAEALAVHRAVASRLADELGMDPGAELRDAHAAVLGRTPPSAPGEQATGTPSGEGPADTAPTVPQAVSVPAQLPYDLDTFTGRRAELDQALRLLSSGAEAADTVVINAIGGMAGVGKTTLAVHWAHRVSDRYPDGQLYVNLRGFDPSGAVMTPAEAVRGFLDTLGVPPERVPRDLDAQSALYRDMLAGRRFLVLLDNARDTEHVRPLLPAAPGCLTLVTSRDRLTDLVTAHGAHALTLRPLDVTEARELLVRRLGGERTDAEPDAVAEITALCAGLPLALACVAARAATHPHFSLSAVAAELREAHGSLDAFSRADASADVGVVFSWSSRALSPAAARLFRLLGLHPGPDVTAPAAAALAGLTVPAARTLLTELSRLHLITEHTPGRYAFHDLLRAHAAELAHTEHDGPARRAAVDRLFRHYLHTAHAAGLLIAPYADGIPLDPAPADTRPEPLADDERALAWLTAEHAVLLAVVHAAAHSGADRLACLLVSSLERYFDRQGHWHDWLAVQHTAHTAALRHADPVLDAHGVRGLARAEGRLNLHDEAAVHLARALDLFTGLGDDAGRASVHRSLAWEAEQRGDLHGALRHDQLALDVLRATGSPAARASALNAVGWSHATLGEYRQALDHCSEALAMLEELGDQVGQAATWDSIAYAHHHLGDHPRALAGYRRALALYQEAGVPAEEAGSLVRIGDVHRATGDHEAARAAWESALARYTELSHPDADRIRARLAES